MLLLDELYEASLGGQLGYSAPSGTHSRYRHICTQYDKGGLAPAHLAEFEDDTRT